MQTATMDKSKLDNCRATYDSVADEYVRRIYDELQHKPADRELLNHFATMMRGKGVVCDVGCGPGHVTRYLHERGAVVCGADLSPRMIDHARRLNPGIEFYVDNMAELNAADGDFAAIVSFYSIVHVSRDELPAIFQEWKRALRPDGHLLLAFHIGDEVIHLDEWWDVPVRVDFHFFRSAEIAEMLARAGFEVEQVIERDPYPEVEHQSRRCYIIARI